MKMMKFKVAGVSYYKDNILELADENDDYLLLSNRELIESYDVGDKIYQYEFNPKHVELIPDPENEYDKNAVRVEIDGLQVGHIKKGSCSQVKNLLASPDFLRVEVDSMGLGGYKRICEEYEEDEYDWYSEKGPKRKVYVEKGEYESCWVHILICMREPEDVNAPVVSPLENKAEPGAKSSEFNEREKGEKKLEKWHIIVIAAVLALVGALLIVYGVMPSESTPSNTALQTESTSQVSSEAEVATEEEDVAGSTSAEASNSNNADNFKLSHGELLDANPTGGVDGKTLVIKAKINSNLTNKMTIDQNYYNVADIITKQGGDRFTEISYWAVADMTNGEESKVIQFHVNADTIKAVSEERILPNQLQDYVDDLWILPGLEN